MKVQQIQKQKQVISQDMIQSVEILQMSSLDLTSYIQEMALENPVVDIVEKNMENIQDRRLKEQEWLSNLDEENRVYLNSHAREEEDDFMNNIGVEVSESLADFLHMQLLGQGYTDHEMEIFDFIAECLDNRGYFTEPISTISQHFSISTEKAEKYLSLMKELEPVGVCAGTLQECLVKQLKKMPGDHTLEIRLIQDYLELLGKNQLHVIAKKMRVSLDEIIVACEHIRRLDPKPGRRFGQGEMLRFIEPDITVVKLKGYMEILLNNYSVPSFRVNKSYLSMLKSDCEREVKDYLNNKVRQAAKVQECISKRNTTLLALAKYIVEQQESFFRYPAKELKPMRIADAAISIGVHESTVRRAVKDKYLQCCWGLYPLNFFFSRGGVQSSTEEEIATVNVKKELQRLVQEENKKKPYSDQKLADILTEMGINISRRTVTKYREAMGIANGRERKEF